MSEQAPRMTTTPGIDDNPATPPVIPQQDLVQPSPDILPGPVEIVDTAPENAVVDNPDEQIVDQSTSESNNEQSAEEDENVATEETEDTRDEARDAYVAKALQNLKATSRTAAGTIDTSASSTKADAMVEGLSSAEIADTAVRNFAETIGELYDMRDVEITSPTELREMFEASAKQINGGLLKEGQLIRSGEDSDKYPYTRIADLEPAMEEFYETLFTKLNDPTTDPVELAAFVEFRIDLSDHFFADGCGKTAKAMSAWVLMRAGEELPTYRDRKELYANAPKTIRNQDPTKAQEELKAWQEYYKTLF